MPISSKMVVAYSVTCLALLAGQASAQVTYSPIAISGAGQNGQYGPQIGTNVFSANAFSTVGRSSVINDAGDVAFTGAFAGGIGVWRNLTGTNNAVARAGTPLPAPAASGNYGTAAPASFNSPFMADNGVTGFYHVIAGTTGPLGSNTDAGYFRTNANDTTNFIIRGSNTGGLGATSTGAPFPVDHTANPATQLNGSTGGSYLMNRAGHSLFSANFNTGTTSGGALLLGMPVAGGYDAMTPVIIRNDPVAALNGALYDFTGGTPSFNDNDRVAFGGEFQSGTGNPALPSSNNRGLMTNRNGEFEVLYVRAASAPFLPAGAIIGDIGAQSPSMNNAGQIAVMVPMNTTVGGVTQANDRLLVRFDNDAGRSVFTLREGTASGRVTGGGNGILLGGQLNSTSGFSNAVISGNGTMFASSTGNVDTTGAVLPAGAGNSALFSVSYQTNTINVIALTGDTAPGTGGTFASFNATSRAVNDNDQIAFLSNLNVADSVTTSNDLCLYATDLSGNLVLIAREGFALENDPVAGRTITSILFNSSVGNVITNGQDGRGMCFNNSGDLVFNVGFSDGNSAVIVAHVVPAPGVAGLLAIGAVAAGRRRRA